MAQEPARSQVGPDAVRQSLKSWLPPAQVPVLVNKVLIKTMPGIWVFMIQRSSDTFNSF
ncbi:MAG: hypothetical protein PVJ15_09070 [Gammaproteobacteria bacterium]